MTTTDNSDGFSATFRQAEDTGLKLAIRGRFLALILLGPAILLTRDTDRTGEFMLMFGGFALIGVVHYAVIGSRWDRRWIKYVMLGLDTALICLALAVGPLHPTADVPQYMVFRTDLFPFMFLFLAVSAFSFSPGLIVWAGCAISLGWMTVFVVLTNDLPAPLEWTDVRSISTSAEYLAVVTDPRFIATGSRMQEVGVLLVTSLALAGVMYRARSTIRARLEAEEQRAAVTRVFGQYVPAEVAERLVADEGSLDPVLRDATVLFTDLQGFTAMTEALGPTRTVAVLNDYFDAAGDIVARHRGVVTQFQGDAIVATFNVPVEIDGHARAAVNAGREIRELTDQRQFQGLKLTARVGIATGPLVAGSVGGGGRQTYTVHGDTVNLAARLEALNKELGTRLLVSQATRDAAGPAIAFEQAAQTSVRGQSGTINVFALA